MLLKVCTRNLVATKVSWVIIIINIIIIQGRKHGLKVGRFQYFAKCTPNLFYARESRIL